MKSLAHDFISELFKKIDEVGAYTVSASYSNIVNHYSAVMHTLTAIYTGFIFLKMKRGHYNANDFLMLTLKCVVILTLAMKYDYFCLFLYDVLTNLPLELCQVITINGSHTTVSSISTALDNFADGGTDAALHIFLMGSWSNPTYFIFGVIMFLFVLFAAGFATCLIMFAKIAAIAIFAVSPLFIFFAMFEATKSMFNSFMSYLITCALIPVMTCSVLMMLLGIMDVVINDLKTLEQVNIKSLIPLGLMCIIQIYLLLQIQGLCAALSGGFSFPHVVSALKHAKNDAASAMQSVAAPVANMLEKARNIGRSTHTTNTPIQNIQDKATNAK